jgi:hypothetical protein
VTVERFGSEELAKVRTSGFAPPGDVNPGPLALGQSTFLLDPGGQDYVGSNSYDAEAEWMNRSHHDQSV